MNRTRNLYRVIVGAVALALTSSIFAQIVVPPDTVLAFNARAKITYADLLADMERLPEENRIEFLLNEKRVAAVIENLLINKIMSAEARASGLQDNPKAAAEIRNQTERVLAKYRREELETKAPKIDLFPLGREIYLTRLKDFERQAIYTSWHTLIKTQGRTLESAREIAKLVKAKVDAGGPLDQIAKEFSNDESVTANSGYITPTPLSNLDREFANVLEKLKEGESGIVETDYGVHVVRLLKMIPRHRPTLEEVKPYLLAEADKVYKVRIVEDHLKSIRTDPTLKFEKEVLKQIRPKLPEIPPPPAAAPPTRPF
ncbi:MAG: peptidylprolyl isomerase [Aeromicrobium sp.]|nr:peptidylprolyl isomerase [Burkholderiales bacterium]